MLIRTLAAVALAATVLPAAELLVLNKDENSLAFVDPATSKVLGRVSTGDAPHELVVSNDGKLAFASNYGTAKSPGTSISVIDVPGRKEIRRLELGALKRPHGLAFAEGKLWFTAEVNKVIGRYDPASNQIDFILGTGQNSTHMVLPNADVSKIFTANIGSDSITMFEQGPNPLAWNATVIPVGKGPEALDLSPDGRELWTAHSGDGGVSIIDIAGRKVAQTLNIHTKRSNRLKFTPDGKRVLVSDLAGGEVVVIDAATHKEIKRIPMGKTPEGILILPDGSRAYVAEAGDNQIAVLDLSTLQITGRFSPGKGPDGMAWVANR